MQLTINNSIYTDNSQEIDENSIFVVSNLNKKFEEDVKKRGCKEILPSCRLKNLFDFSTIKIVGITGTNGKTTTAAAIYSILLDLGYKVALQGTRGFFINDEQIKKYSLTTPMQLENFGNIQEAISNNCQFFIMEVSSHAIEQNRIEGLEFALKVHTNITQDHLDYHKSIDEYVRVKNSFFEDECKKLINKDDEFVKFNPKNAFTYSLEKPSTYKVDAYSFKNQMEVLLRKIEKQVEFSSYMMGVFNIYNLVAAIGTIDILTNFTLEDICKNVPNFAGVGGRVQVVSYKPLVIIDFAHTPDGMQKVLESFPSKDIVCVFGAGGNRDATKRPIMGAVAQKYSKHIIVTSDNPRFEDPDLIVQDILKGITNHKSFEVEINRKEAIKKAINIGKQNSNSVVLILGKGDEAYQIIYDKKLPFSDKEVVEEMLKISS